jgi:N-acylneuraminate cytidylyltransferase
MSKNITALIAVRSGSLRVKNKNIRPFNDSTLLELKIKQLQQVPEIDSIVVNSNSVEMLDIAHQLGVEYIKRDDFYASNTVSMSEVFRNMAENIDCENILYANCTSPLVASDSYSSAINKFFSEDFQHDSLVSCHDIKEFLYLDGKALNYDPANQPRSQDLPDIAALNFAISIISRENMISNSNIIGNHPFFYKLNEVESVDIDTPLDFFLAEELYKKIMILKEDLN